MAKIITRNTKYTITPSGRIKHCI